MERMSSSNIARIAISRYAAHQNNGEYIVDGLSSVIVRSYDDNGLMLKSSVQCYDENGSLTESHRTERKAHEKGYIYERYNHEDELEGYIICDKEGRELESTLFGYHSSTYDGDKLMTHKSVYQHNDEHELSYVYDSSGRITKSIETENGKTTILNHHYSTDIFGNLVETYLDEEGNLLRTEVSDKNTGHIIETKEACGGSSSLYDTCCYRKSFNDVFHARFSEGELIYCHRRFLEYDDDGNWIIEVEKQNVLNEPSIHISIREIHYRDSLNENFF